MRAMLFLDEFPEFAAAPWNLRGPLESGRITISRGGAEFRRAFGSSPP